jgi:peptidyl-prolyl cis-trans isomerase SurA
MYLWKKICIFLSCAIFSNVLFCGNARSEVLDRIVATVNGEIILYSELQEQIKRMERIAPDLKTYEGEKKAQMEQDVLQQLIRQRLTDAEVQRLKITITNAEVDQAVEDVKAQNKLTKAQFEEGLKQDGMSLERFRENVKKELERNRLLERVLKMKTVITDQQVDAYLKEDNAETAPGRMKIHLGAILLPVDEKGGNAKEVEKNGQEILGKLKNGSDFKDLAVKFSKGPAAAEGGDIGSLGPDELAPFIADAVKNLKPGDISGLVRGPGGYYILKVFDFDRQKPNKGDPAMREKVRRELFQKEVNRKFDEWVRNLESKAFIQNTL